MTTSGIEISKVSPRFLESNATSHTWPFSAIAELIDNAYDPDVAAKELWIDQVNISNMPCLLFKDNGNGMDHEHLLKMLSFGFCEKDQYLLGETRLPIGQYGNGFKSGSMRLANDALVFTVCKQSASIGFLSRTYLEAVKADNVFIPLLHYSVPELEKIDDGNFGPNLEAILTHSPFKTEQDLEEELRKISKAVGNSRTLRSGIHTGTKICLFNLKTLKSGRHELDFQADPKDVRNPEVFEPDTSFEGPTTSDESSGPTTSYRTSQHLVSLRKYCGILFLKPRMNIIIRGQRVTRKIISSSLSRTQCVNYKPGWSKEPLKITFGFTQEEEYSRGNYGIFLYHRNRLIRPYEKVGYQKKPDGKGVGVVGVVEVNCLKPIHNKQDFMRDESFNTFIKTLGTKLNDYCDQQPEDILEVLRQEAIKSDLVCCDECDKWRKLPDNTPCPRDGDRWTCSMNTDSQHNRCHIPEEPEIHQTPAKRQNSKKSPRKQPRCDMPEEPETQTPANRRNSKKSPRKQPNAGKRKSGEGKEKETKRARGETTESRRSEDPQKECTIIIESDGDEEYDTEQLEEDLQRKAAEQENEDEENEEMQLPGCSNTISTDFSPLDDSSEDLPDLTVTQQSRHRYDLNEHDVNMAINSLVFPHPIYNDTRGAPCQTDLQKSNSGSKNVPPKTGKTQVNPASASNQKKSSTSNTDKSIEREATRVSAQHQDTDLKTRFDTFKINVHDMLNSLQPDEDHGSVEEIEDTVEKILAKYRSKDDNWVF